MIITRTPFRMSYVGGGTDIASFYRDGGGAVLSTAIDKYMYITVHKKFDDGVRVAYSQVEEVQAVSDICHPLVREALAELGLNGGVEITSTADIPAKGTGLGSSSSYTVGLLSALHAFMGKQIRPEDLASMACKIEIERCEEPIGKQDQYAAAIGGLKLYEFHSDESVSITPVQCSASFRGVLDDSTLIFYTGKTRSASGILAEQTKNSASSEKKIFLRRMAELAYEFKAGIEAENLFMLGDLLKENWSLKKRLASGITNPHIDEMYLSGMQAGAIGGKLLGAGAGGFMMFLVDSKNREAVIKAMSQYRRFDFRIERSGSSVIYYG